MLLVKKSLMFFQILKISDFLRYSRGFGKQANQKDTQLTYIRMKELKVGGKITYTNFRQGIWWQFMMI